MNLNKSLKKLSSKPKGPVWAGPESDADNGGITQSLLNRFLSCRTRFHVKVMEGLEASGGFRHALEFGNMWHVCEEALAGFDEDGGYRVSGDGNDVWNPALTTYAQGLRRTYPTAQADIQNWYEICRMMFPIYVNYWKDHPDVQDRVPIFQEQIFKVPYKLPSGRVVYLRGKWDSIDLIGKGNTRAVYLQENKTKGEINEAELRRQLVYDMQVMFYIVALEAAKDKFEPKVKRYFGGPTAGVRYNVVKRPRHYQGKKETREEFLERLQGIIKESPQEFFMRWRVDITEGDIKRFQRECLNPILENLYDWWECVNHCAGGPFERCKKHGNIRWRHPFGCANYVDEWGSSEVDSYLDTGSTTGLKRVETLFPELEAR